MLRKSRDEFVTTDKIAVDKKIRMCYDNITDPKYNYGGFYEKTAFPDSGSAFVPVAACSYGCVRRGQ
jgi:hypothetical protein